MSNAKRGAAVAGLFLCLCASAAIYGCALSATRAGGSVDEQTRSYELKPGQEVAVHGADFTMMLGAVEEDSRCPEGVECIWAGSVRVEVVFCGPKAERSGRLNTGVAPRALKYRGRYVRIARVGPRKVRDQEIKPSDYRITLEVSKTPPPNTDEGDVIEIKDE
jgi:hypothetical protein